ncbi:MAG: Wzz/FepE/Etk N-terminal domain-containing protein, partial [Actinomycetes bacterium]
MENNKPNLNSTQNKDNIDYRELMLKYMHKWPWFLLSVIICVFVAFIYLKSTNNQFQVQSTILLRKDPSNNGSLIDMSMLEGLGISGTSKEVEDEIQVLSSKALTQNVIKTLHFETEYYIENGLRYEEVYPKIPVKIILPAAFNDTTKQPIELKIKAVSD